MTWLANLCRTSPAKRIDELLFEAARQALEHEAAAEHHQALADMYRKREKRLAYLKSTQQKEEA